MYYRIYPLFNGVFNILFKSVPPMENIHSFAFLLVDESGEMVLVDAGFSPNYIPGLHTSHQQDSSQQIPAAIDKLGFDPSSVGTVIMTHLHWDHTADMNNFANARFYIQADEFRGLFHLNPNEETYSCPSHWLNILPRVELLEGNQELHPGLRVIQTGGHTRGHQMVEVSTPSGLVLLAGDAPFNYDLLWEMISPEGWKLFREGPGARFYWDKSVLPRLGDWMEERKMAGPIQGEVIPWSQIKLMGKRIFTTHDPRLLERKCIE